MPTIEEKCRAIDTLLDCMESVTINTNDIFAPAASSDEMEVNDLVLMMPLISKWGHVAFEAYFSVKLKQKPWKKSLVTEKFKMAREEILTMKKSMAHFMAEE